MGAKLVSLEGLVGFHSHYVAGFHLGKQTIIMQFSISAFLVIDHWKVTDS